MKCLCVHFRFIGMCLLFSLCVCVVLGVGGLVLPGSSRQGVGTVPASSNVAASQ